MSLRFGIILLACGLASAVPSAAAAAAADPAAVTLDRDRVLSLARERAPEILATRARVTGAGGEVAAARAWRSNPELALEVGPRRNPLGTSTDRMLRLSQPLDLGFNGRGARIDAARAAERAVRGEGRSTVVEVLAEASAAHLRALHARSRVAVAGDLLALTQRLHDIARLRREAGEVGTLDTQVATVARASARVALLRAEAEAEAARAELLRILALDDDGGIALAGEIAWPAPPGLAAVRAAAGDHPHLAALAARTEQAQALHRVAAAASRPEFALAAGLGREEESDLVKFGLSMSLPVLNTGSGERIATAAADTVARLELDRDRRRILGEATTAWRRHDKLASALATFLDEAVAAHDASVQLAEESYRGGRIDLGEVLTVQRELLDARVEALDLQLEVALAALEVHMLAALPPLAAVPADEGVTKP